MMTPWIILAAASPLLDFDMRDFGEDAVVYGNDPVIVASSAILLWPRGTLLRLEPEDEELVIRFNQPVDEGSIARFEAALSDRIATLRWNDDSLLLRPVGHVSLSAKADVSRLIVTFMPRVKAAASHPTSPPDAADVKLDRDRDMVAIRADLASGFVGKALGRAQQLAQRDPDDADVRRLLADTQAINGDHQAAANSYRAAGADDNAAQRSMALEPGHIAISTTMRDGTDFNQIEAVARATITPGNKLTVSGALRQIDTHSDAAVMGEALREDIDTGATLTDLTVTTQIAPLLHMDFTGSLWLDTGVAGGGLRLIYGSSDTQFRIGYIHRLPDLSFAEQAIDQGRLSQFTLGGSAQLSPELRGRLDLGWRRYGLSDNAHAAETLTVAGQLDYILLRRPLLVTLGYRMDAEYVQHLSHTASGLGRLPLSDRENHTAQAFASGAIGPILVTGGAGWTTDRYGGSGPNASLAASMPVGIRWQIDTAFGVTSITRPAFPGRQLFGKVELRRALGNGS